MIEPVFEIDRHGITICKHHSRVETHGFNFNYDFLDSNVPYDPITVRFRRDQYAWCDTCDHFRKNECYFKRDEIIDIKRGNGILLGYLFNKYKCELCGVAIRNYFNVMRVRYLKQKENIEIPVLCSSCNYSLKENKLKSRIRVFIIMDFILLSLLIFFSSLLISLTISLSSDINVFLYVLCFCAVLQIFSIIFIKKIIYLARYKRRLKAYTIDELLI